MRGRHAYGRVCCVCTAQESAECIISVMYMKFVGIKAPHSLVHAISLCLLDTLQSLSCFYAYSLTPTTAFICNNISRNNFRLIEINMLK